MYSDYPRVPHLPGSHHSPEDVHLSPGEAQALFECEVAVFEKTDGLNLSVTREGRDRLRVGLKWEWRKGAKGGPARMIDIFVEQHRRAFLDLLKPGETAYGEWVRHRISLPYTALPAPYFFFSMASAKGRILPLDKARARAQSAGLPMVSPLWRGKPKTLEALTRLAGRSQFWKGHMEGIIVERVSGQGPRLCKWVRADYLHPRAGQIDGILNGLSKQARQKTHLPYRSWASSTTASKRRR
jgi:hypothetical protein